MCNYKFHGFRKIKLNELLFLSQIFCNLIPVLHIAIRRAILLRFDSSRRIFLLFFLLLNHRVAKILCSRKRITLLLFLNSSLEIALSNYTATRKNIKIINKSIFVSKIVNAVLILFSTFYHLFNFFYQSSISFFHLSKRRPFHTLYLRIATWKNQMIRKFQKLFLANVEDDYEEKCKSSYFLKIFFKERLQLLN